MNEPKFTPGPWRIGTPPPNGEQIIGTVAGLMVAVATTGHKMAEETKVNAHLIAAAPELYWALDLAKQMFVANNISLPHTMEVIDAALAKARGESHD